MNGHPFLQAGDFRIRLTIETPVETPDGHGGYTRQWLQQGLAWARIVPVSGILFHRADAIGAETTHWVYVRAEHAVKAGMRLVRGARIFAITNVRDPDETGRYLACECTEEQEDTL